MTLARPLIERLGERLRRDLEAATLGHCLRIDHLTDDDAVALCKIVDNSGADGIQISMLDPQNGHRMACAGRTRRSRFGTASKYVSACSYLRVRRTRQRAPPKRVRRMGSGSRPRGDREGAAAQHAR